MGIRTKTSKKKEIDWSISNTTKTVKIVNPNCTYMLITDGHVSLKVNKKFFLHKHKDLDYQYVYGVSQQAMSGQDENEVISIFNCMNNTVCGMKDFF